MWAAKLANNLGAFKAIHITHHANKHDAKAQHFFA
jgi:hypothetical protein